MFFDSNFVGLFLLPLLVVNMFYISCVRGGGVYYASFFFIVLLILATFSRSAIISAIISLYFYFLYICLLKYKRFFLLAMFASMLSIPFLLIYTIEYFLIDGSFSTKLAIFQSLQSFFEHDLTKILFGYGVDYGGTIYTYKEDAYAHALIPLILGQFGILGVLVIIGFFSYYSFRIGFFGWLLFLVIMVSGLSLADPWQILNYISFLLMYHYKSTINRSRMV